MIVVLSYELPHKFAEFESPELIGCFTDMEAAETAAQVFIPTKCDEIVTINKRIMNKICEGEVWVINEVEPPWFISFNEVPDKITNVWKPMYECADKQKYIIFEWHDDAWQ
jgi:hypothetical protein